MRVDPLGESAYILRELGIDPPEAARRLQMVPGIVEAYAAFDTVGIISERPIDLVEIESALAIASSSVASKQHVIPVLYDGEDLAEVARQVNRSPDEVIELHTQNYECLAVGFCPGFAYLGPLGPKIDLPRRPDPRTRVAPGSVAIAAGMTAVYPLERPGGWWLIGRTPLTLVDESSDYFPIQAGDRVRFEAIDETEYAFRMGERL